MATPSLASGIWVTSFIAWFPIDPPWQFIPEFAATRFRLKSDEGRQAWDAGWELFVTNSANDEELGVASAKHPAPQSVLGCFSFQNNKTFTGDFAMNAMGWFATFPIHGTYSLQPHTTGGWGGEIILLESDDVTPHMRLRFLMVSRDELTFITSFRKDEVAANFRDMLQTVAGTMRRATV